MPVESENPIPPSCCLLRIVLVMGRVKVRPQAVGNRIRLWKYEHEEIPRIFGKQVLGCLNTLVSGILQGLHENFAAALGEYFVGIDDVFSNMLTQFSGEFAGKSVL